MRRVDILNTRAVEAARPDAAADQKSSEDLFIHPWLASGGDGGSSGAVLAAIGATIAALRVRPGHVCLEIGTGVGNFAVTLAQMGCDTTYFGLFEGGLVARRVRALAVAVDVVDGPWQDLTRLVEGRRFDLVLFDAGLSRCPDHVEMLRILREKLLAPGGRLALIGEPQREGSQVSRELDHPGDASASVDERWSSTIGFRPDYLTAVLDATGFVPVEFEVPFVTGGKVIVASRKR